MSSSRTAERTAPNACGYVMKSGRVCKNERSPDKPWCGVCIRRAKKAQRRTARTRRKGTMARCPNCGAALLRAVWDDREGHRLAFDAVPDPTADWRLFRRRRKRRGETPKLRAKIWEPEIGDPYPLRRYRLHVCSKEEVAMR